ncbi:MAG TPA: hypothetical protein VGJ28_08305, partial [Micromonosporaceae bacterium]
WNGPRFHAPLAYYLIVFCCAGLPNVVSYVGMATIFENATPGPMRGRVFAVLGAITGTATLIGMFVAGIAVDHLPAGLVLNLQGLSFIAGAAVAWWLLQPPAPVAVPATG